MNRSISPGSVRINGVRTNYHGHAVRFYCQDHKTPDKSFIFNSQDVAGAFMLLIRKRVGDEVEITAK